MRPDLNLTGQRFGTLVATGFSHKDGHGRAFFHCACDCGAVRSVRADNLLSGHTRNCGCERSLKHGMSYTTEFKAWISMKYRCANPKCPKWKDYGGRGIKVCDRWLHSFENFLADMGKKPSPELTLDRKDNDGNYEPGNCRWATMAEQSNNRRPAKLRKAS